MRPTPVLAALTLAALALPSAAQGGPPPPGGGFPNPPVPAGNPVTPEKTLLGKALFWDEQMSSTRTMACGSCHVPSAGGSDPRTAGPGATHPGADGSIGTLDDVLGSPGVVVNDANGAYAPDVVFGLSPQVTGRKAPSAINSAFSRNLFWDGRADESFEDPLTGNTVQPLMSALETQAAGPPLSDVEMAHAGRDWQDVADRIEASDPLALSPAITPDLTTWIAGRDYPALFLEVFGTADVTPVRILQAIATYERVLVSDQAPFDAFVTGTPGALTPQELRGLQIFNGPSGCAQCHTGPLFTDDAFHDIGVRPEAEDVGRAGVTGNPADRGRFKTPTLRNVGLRSPYFHQGGKATLNDVVDFYNRGGDFANPGKDPRIRPLGLNPGQRADLVAFLQNALTDPRVANEQAPFDRPALYAESLLVPALYGAGTAGSGGAVPAMVALEPPSVGNPNLTLAVGGGLGNAPVFFALDVTPAPAGIPVAGVTVYLALTGGLVVIPAGNLVGIGAGNGHTSLSFALPDDPLLAGLDLYTQWFAFDAGAVGGISASEAAQVRFF